MTQSITWHASKDNQDRLMKHLRDSETWKTFDLLHPKFADDPQNVHLGLPTTSFNPLEP